MSLDADAPLVRVAVPNKGSLAEPASQMLREAGYRQRSSQRELALRDPDNATEFFFLRPRDIAVYVGSGRLDVGFTGRDLLLDSGADAEEILPLGFAASTLRFAARAGQDMSVDDLDGQRIATAYPGLVERHLAELGVTAEVITLDGAVETSVRLGVADVIADVVETGSTLKEAGLEVFGEPILRSEAVLVRRTGLAVTPAVQQLERRLQGVLVARTFVMMDYDCPTDLVDAACALTPGTESPTVSPLQREGWVAVRALVERRDTNRVMDALYDLGARGILTTDIHACRL